MIIIVIIRIIMMRIIIIIIIISIRIIISIIIIIMIIIIVITNIRSCGIASLSRCLRVALHGGLVRADEDDVAFVLLMITSRSCRIRYDCTFVIPCPGRRG